MANADSLAQTEIASHTNSATRTRFVWRILPLLVFAGLAFLLGCFEITDYDFWWHLRTGELIPDRGVPRIDWFSFNAQGIPWVDVQWCFQLLIAWIHNHFGLAGIVLMRATVASLAIFVALQVYKRDWPIFLQVAIWAPALLVMSRRFYERPEVFTLLFTAIYLAILFRAEERPKLLWCLVPLQILWANFHGLFVLGPCLLGMYLVEAIARVFRNPKHASQVFIVFITVCAASLVSPYRLDNLTLALDLWDKIRPGNPVNEFYSQHIAELKPFVPYFKSGGYLTVSTWLLLGLLGLSILSMFAAWRKILFEQRFFRPLAQISFGLLGLGAIRNWSHFALVTATMTCWNFGELNWKNGWGTRKSIIATWVLLLGMGWLIGSEHWFVWGEGERRFGLGERTSFYSWPAMKLAGRPEMPKRAIHFNFGHAATYIYANGPDRQVFMDGRLEVLPQQIFRLQNEIGRRMEQGENWDSILVSSDTPMIFADGENNYSLQAAVFLHKDWKCIYYDEVLGVFVRRDLENLREYPAIDFRAHIFANKLPFFEAPIPATTAQPGWFLRRPKAYDADRNDYLSRRTSFLSAMLGQQNGSGSVTARALAWYSCQSGQIAVRRRPWVASTYRNLGNQFQYIAATSFGRPAPLHVKEPWESPIGIMQASAIWQFKQAMLLPDAESTPLYLMQACAQSGLLDEELAQFAHVTKISGENESRQQALKDLPAKRADLEKELAKARPKIGENDRSFNGLKRYVENGFVREGIDSIDWTKIKDQGPEQVDRLGTWMFLLGEPELARKLYRAFLNDANMPPGLVELRLGCCDQIIGHYSEAREHYQKALELGASKEEAFCLLAMLHLMAGNQSAFEAYLSQGKKSATTEQYKVVFKELEELLPEK